MLQKLTDDIKQAMKGGNKDRLEVLRMMKSKIQNVDTRGTLSDAECQKIVSSYAKGLRESVKQYRDLGKSDVAGKLEAELKIIEEYLPKSLSPEEVKALVVKTIQEVGATSKKDMGKVMKAVLGANPTLDGNAVKDAVMAALP